MRQRIGRWPTWKPGAAPAPHQATKR